MRAAGDGDDVQQQHQRVVSTELGEMTELPSMCPRCMTEDGGVTKVMLADIPHFRQVLLSSFECSHCPERNNEIQFGGQFAPMHVQYELRVDSEQDLNRQVVRSEYSTLRIPEIDLEIPPPSATTGNHGGGSGSSGGSLSTVEGILQETSSSLAEGQPVRRITDPEMARKLDDFLEKVDKLRGLESGPFSVVLSDPSGNSYVEPLHFDMLSSACAADSKLRRRETERTAADRRLLGLEVAVGGGGGGTGGSCCDDGGGGDAESVQKQPQQQQKHDDNCPSHQQKQKYRRTEQEERLIDAGVLPTAGALRVEDANHEDEEQGKSNIGVVEMPTNCSACGKPGAVKMHKCSHIPHFEETVIFAFRCDYCGFKSNDVKTGGAIPEKGLRLSLSVKTKADLSREVLKSNTAGISIPEVGLEALPGTLGGFFSTVEGVVRQVAAQLGSLPELQFTQGDSASAAATSTGGNCGNGGSTTTTLASFAARLEQLLDDLPATNSVVDTNGDSTGGTAAASSGFTIIVDDPLASIYIQQEDIGGAAGVVQREEYVRTWEQDEELGLHDMVTDVHTPC